jgi:hypothetical protein
MIRSCVTVIREAAKTSSLVIGENLSCTGNDGNAISNRELVDEASSVALRPPHNTFRRVFRARANLVSAHGSTGGTCD